MPYIEVTVAARSFADAVNKCRVARRPDVGRLCVHGVDLKTELTDYQAARLKACIPE